MSVALNETFENLFNTNIDNVKIWQHKTSLIIKILKSFIKNEKLKLI